MIIPPEIMNRANISLTIPLLPAGWNIMVLGAIPLRFAGDEIVLLRDGLGSDGRASEASDNMIISTISSLSRHLKAWWVWRFFI